MWMDNGVWIDMGRTAWRLRVEPPGCPVHGARRAIHAFAVRELKRVLRGCGALAVNGQAGGILQLSSGEDASDGFRISPVQTGLEIHGNNPRSLLFGVYAFLERYAGCRWFEPGEEIIPWLNSIEVELPEPWAEAPAIARRYVMPEGMVFSLALMRQFIAWAPRNRVGDIAISFDAWSAWRETLIPEIEKRGLAVTLSGHGLREFVSQREFRRHPKWFAEIRGKRVRSGQYCFSSHSFREALSGRIIRFLGKESVIRRISFWAEDTALVCECAACRGKGFLKSFVQCVNHVAREARRRHPRVAIDFLAYNAALAWDMLEPAQGLDLSSCSTEIAYWGRDYRYGLKQSPLASDRRAERCLRKWRRLIPGTLSVLEYYTDLWMLTHLIPPLPHRIARDCQDYAALGVDGLGSLICLASSSLHPEPGLRDRFAPMTYPNLYFFAVFAWNPKQRVKAVLEDYARRRFGADAPLCLGYLRKMERLLPVITSFNQILFRLRFVDIWMRDEGAKQGGIYFRPVDWTPARGWNREARRRLAVCARLAREMDGAWPLAEKDCACRGRTAAFRLRWQAVCARVKGLHIQLTAQQAMIKGDRGAAVRLLKEAIAMKEGVTGSERVTCKKWLCA